MKQAVAALLLVVLLSGLSQAQVGLGVKGGVNFSTVGGADVTTSPSTLTGFVGGAYLDINIPFLLSIQPEVLYSMKGYKEEASLTFLGNTYSMTETVTLSYLEIPVLFKYSLPVPVLKPSLFVGPSVGILLSAKAKTEVTGQPTQDIDIKSSTTSTDFGAVFGASAHVAVVDLDVRYTLGLKTLDKDSQSKVYNRGWSITVGIPLL